MPEAEEADVELTRRLPLKHISEDILSRTARPRAVQLEHLGDCVDGRHTIRIAKELLGPQPAPGSELEDVSPRSNDPSTASSSRTSENHRGFGLRGQRVGIAAEPPVVVLWRPLAVVPPLFGQHALDRGLIHTARLSSEPLTA